MIPGDGRQPLSRSQWRATPGWPAAGMQAYDEAVLADSKFSRDQPKDLT